VKFVRHKTKGFFIFTRSMDIYHSHVGKFLGKEDIVSAGFVRFVNGLPECYGMSESLSIGCSPLDTKLLQSEMGFKKQ